jgi:hypothetical protein
LHALAGQVDLEQVAAGGTSGARQHDNVRRAWLTAQYRLNLMTEVGRAYHANMQQRHALSLPDSGQDDPAIREQFLSTLSGAHQQVLAGAVEHIIFAGQSLIMYLVDIALTTEFALSSGGAR